MSFKNSKIAALCISLVIISCDKQFLEQEPIGTVSESELYNKSGVNSLLISAYSALNINVMPNVMGSNPDQPLFGVIHGGECFKGSDAGDQPAFLETSQFSITTGNSDVDNFWIYYYDAIYKCNQVLSIMEKVTDMTVAEKTNVRAEVRFLRGHFYFYLKRAFKNIPWVDETVADYRVPNTDGNGDYVNIWPQIAADFDYARNYLPNTQSDIGRPNKWAADIYYAKVLIYRNNEGEYPTGYVEALAILDNAIKNGITSNGLPYDLLPDYHDNFDASTENGAESVWAVQYSVNDGTPSVGFGSSPNGDLKAVWIGSQSKSGPGIGIGYGFYQPTPWYADHFRTDANGLPYLDMYETNPVRLKDDYGINSVPDLSGEDSFIPDTSGVDPRLDWTISRRGIPCLDYGNFPGSSWIRNQEHGGPYMVKKWFIRKSQIGIYTASGDGKTAMNICVIRFADVLLLAAECEVMAGSLNNARALVNRVRNRMIRNSDSRDNWVKKADGTTNAANYRVGIYPNGGAHDPFLSTETAMDAILFERSLELGTEGNWFYDVVRLGKGTEIFNQFINAEKERFDYLEGHEYNEIPDSYLPIPRDAVDRSQKNGVATLTQNPGY